MIFSHKRGHASGWHYVLLRLCLEGFVMPISFKIQSSLFGFSTSQAEERGYTRHRVKKRRIMLKFVASRGGVGPIPSKGQKMITFTITAQEGIQNLTNKKRIIIMTGGMMMMIML